VPHYKEEMRHLHLRNSFGLARGIVLHSGVVCSDAVRRFLREDKVCGVNTGVEKKDIISEVQV
jgi:hypothetical protein